MLDATISVVDIPTGGISEPVPLPAIDSPTFAVGFGSLWMPDFSDNLLYRPEPFTCKS